MISARAMAVRCCSPPESSPGLWRKRCPSPTSLKRVVARASASSFGDAGDQGRHHHILQRRKFREELIELKDETDGAVAEFVEHLPLEGEDLLPGKVDRPRRRAIEAAENMHQRRLAGAGGADNRHPFAASDRQVDIMEDIDPARSADKALVDSGDPDQCPGSSVITQRLRRIHARRPPGRIDRRQQTDDHCRHRDGDGIRRINDRGEALHAVNGLIEDAHPA